MATDAAKLNEPPGRSDVGTTAPPQPPIGRYRRVPVQVHQADPHAGSSRPAANSRIASG